MRDEKEERKKHVHVYTCKVEVIQYFNPTQNSIHIVHILKYSHTSQHNYMYILFNSFAHISKQLMLFLNFSKLQKL